MAVTTKKFITFRQPEIPHSPPLQRRKPHLICEQGSLPHKGIRTLETQNSQHHKQNVLA